MAKSLSQWIADKEASKSTPGQRKAKGSQNRAAFLAVRGEVAQALIDGWSMRKVWEALVEQKKISMSYDPFTKYVNQLIAPQSAATEPAKSEPAAPVKPVDAKSSKQTAAGKSPHQSEARPVIDAGFRLNTNPKKEDLI